MSKHDTDEVEGTDRRPASRNDLAAAATEKTLKRARWEALEFAACPGANRVNVRNASYGDEASEHTYTVTIGPDGLPTDCTCPAAEYQPGPCKHAVAVADAPEVAADAMHGDAPERADDDKSDALGADTDVTTMADLLQADGRLVATDGGTERGGERREASLGESEALHVGDTGADTDGDIEATQPDGEPSDAEYCAKYIVPVSECVLADGEECPHDTITGDTGTSTGADTDARSDTGQETCARCPKPLAECHDEPAGHTVVTTDGEELCPECADARCGEEIGFGQCERENCPYCDSEEADR